MNGSPYHFFVKRGTVNKLARLLPGRRRVLGLTHLRRAGASTATSIRRARDNPNNATTGFGDATNPDNPFKDWNVVFVSYCTATSTSATRRRTTPTPTPARRCTSSTAASHNAQVAEKWAREHFVNPDEVFVTGSSAGAYGAWFNAPLHARRVAGLEVQRPRRRRQRRHHARTSCRTSSRTGTSRPTCPTSIPGLDGRLTRRHRHPGLHRGGRRFYPKTAWAHYTTRLRRRHRRPDRLLQRHAERQRSVAAVTWWQASCAWNAQMRAQAIATAAAVPSNYRYYIGSGSRHTMWGSNKVYTDTTGGVPTHRRLGERDAGQQPARSRSGVDQCRVHQLRPVAARRRAPEPARAAVPAVGPDVVVTCP